MMPLRRRHLTLEDYRAVLTSTEEVSIGAYARRQRRRRLGIALLGLALIAVAVWLYFALRPPDGNVFGQPYPARVRCVQCGYEETISVTGQTQFPVWCPRCQHRTCRELWVCRDCGNLFIAFPRGPQPTTCDRCGSVRVGTAAAADSGRDPR